MKNIERKWAVCFILGIDEDGKKPSSWRKVINHLWGSASLRNNGAGSYDALILNPSFNGLSICPERLKFELVNEAPQTTFNAHTGTCLLQNYKGPTADII